MISYNPSRRSFPVPQSPENAAAIRKLAEEVRKIRVLTTTAFNINCLSTILLRDETAYEIDVLSRRVDEISIQAKKSVQKVAEFEQRISRIEDQNGRILERMIDLELKSTRVLQTLHKLSEESRTLSDKEKIQRERTTYVIRASNSLYEQMSKLSQTLDYLQQRILHPGDDLLF